jgi:hypothetical protein
MDFLGEQVDLIIDQVSETIDIIDENIDKAQQEETVEVVAPEVFEFEIVFFEPIAEPVAEPVAEVSEVPIINTQN